LPRYIDNHSHLDDAGAADLQQDDDSRLKLYLTHRSALVDYATPLMGSRAQAEDVVQEAYFRFVPASATGAMPEKPLPYLYRIVRNLALDMLRRAGAEARREAQAMQLGADLAAPAPDEALQARDDLRRAAAALQDLPERTRRAFELHRFHDRTFQQIADTLGISVTTAHRLVREAMLQVTQRLLRGDS
jgi:RNA polymerase sigma-70 factor (ECF subfamily)